MAASSGSKTAHLRGQGEQTLEMKNTLKEKIASTAVGEKLLSDRQFRSIIIASGSMGWNLLYGIFNGVLGIIYRSAWFITMCAYYMTLGGMRLAVVSLNTEKNGKRSERSIMRHNGIAMLFLAVVLSATVALSFRYSVTKTYPTPIMIAIATYTFYITALAIRNMVRAQKDKSLLMITLRNISLAGAVASMLTLQRSMTATFGSDAVDFANTMNGASGMGAFLIVLVLGITMIIQGSKRRQR